MWSQVSGSSGGSSAGEMGCMSLCHPERKIHLGRQAGRQPA